MGLDLLNKGLNEDQNGIEHCKIRMLDQVGQEGQSKELNLFTPSRTIYDWMSCILRSQITYGLDIHKSYKWPHYKATMLTIQVQQYPSGARTT
jgi:hypothetical protein